MSFPVPVTLTRFFVPECVLFFGMAIAHIHQSWCFGLALVCLVGTACSSSAVPARLSRRIRTIRDEGQAELPGPLAGPVISAVTRRVLPGQDAATGWAGVCR